MRTIDGQYTENKTIKSRFQRDIKLLIHIMRMISQYLFGGTRIRIIYKIKELLGKKYWVDKGRYP